MGDHWVHLKTPQPDQDICASLVQSSALWLNAPAVSRPGAIKDNRLILIAL